MRMFFVAVLVLFSSVALGTELSSGETNSVVAALLKPRLARWSYDPTNGRITGGGRSVSSQVEFFSERQGLSSEDLRACFDWYLLNLTNTVRKTGIRANPMAIAAIDQCRAMSYTNAIPALTQFVDGNPDPAQVSALLLLLEWNELDGALVARIERYLNEESGIHFRDRELLMKALSCKLLNSPTSDWLQDGINILYAHRTSKSAALTTDRTLVDLRPGYSNSVERYEAACLVLSTPGVSNVLHEYFFSVSNQLESVLR